MDLLSSLGIDDLPEQQTRTGFLERKYDGREQEFNLSLGFDACCACGKPLGASAVEKVACPNCRRVSYCSEACRHQDANVSLPPPADEGGEGHHDQDASAMGHSSVICAVLNLCADDEAVDEDGGNGDTGSDPVRFEAARDRVRSEYESYPATLANVLMEGPCYQDVLSRSKKGDSKRLVVHVIGASIDSEFWNLSSENGELERERDGSSCFSAYAEALADLADANRIDTIELVFVGPECPERNIEISKAMESSSSSAGRGGGGVVLMKSFRGLYNAELLKGNSVPKADIVAFFNPGFTVPDYEDWKETLSCIEKGTPFLSTTNTELEGIADCQYLLDQDRIQTLPAGLADIFGLYSGGGGDDDDDGEEDGQSASTAFFSVNPFCGTRVRQSGTMANDLYVKNRWMLGGILDSFDPSKTSRMDAVPSKKQRRAGAESSNSKKDNPALV